MGEQRKKLIGKVTHYYSKIAVAVVELTDSVRIGDEISIEGSLTKFRQKAASMQIEKKDIESAGVGQSIGLKVDSKVREGDLVYKIET